MKTIPPICPEPESGRKYWSSLDALEQTPEFRQWVEREFPQGASEWTDPVSRRHFVKIMSASFLLGGLGLAATGCRRPEQKILPFSKMPENFVHGVPQFYATAMPTRTGAVALVAKSHDGRPVKVEGNAMHPDSNGGTDRWTQASILSLYDPDRAIRFAKAGETAAAQTAWDAIDEAAKASAANGGKGLAILWEQKNSPSRQRLQAKMAQKLPQAKWFTYEPVETQSGVRAATKLFGKSVNPSYRFDQAAIVLSLDSDFLGCEEDVHNNIRKFSARRKLEKPTDSLNRLYIVESMFSLTGFNSDHRLRIPSSMVAQVAAAIGAEVTKQTGNVSGLEKITAPAGVNAQWITECAKDLLRHRGQSIVIAGQRQPEAVHALALMLNSVLGNMGKTVALQEVPESKEGTILELARSLNAREVGSLVILGGNPVYNAPADLDWINTQRKAKTVLRLGYYEDETAPFCTWHFPLAHYLESWGDARTSDGTLVPIQPLIAPLFGGVTELEFLSRLGGEKNTAYEIVRETFAGIAGSDQVEERWKRFLHDGFLANSAAKVFEAELNTTAASAAIASLSPAAVSKDNLEVVFHQDYSLDDGRYNNNGWLQEMPDPITKMVWDNAVMISRRTAIDLGVENMEMVEIAIGGRKIYGPIWIQPGYADNSLGLALGYGRERTGRVGQKVGYNAYPLRTSERMGFATGAKVTRTTEKYTLACTQDHWSLEGRPIIREANLEQYRENPGFAKGMNAPEPPIEKPLYPNPFDALKTTGLHQWGMSIDLNTCVGCSACVLACQSENNIPIVGKDQVRRGRELHWLRIDRYYAGNPKLHHYIDTFRRDERQQKDEWIDDCQVVTQPMMCQHCEAAPCENVCPVNATVHDQEGLNLMVYNRCVGTRYCSNNCPYKVRKFNYFDYNKRPINALYKGPFGHRKDDEWDLLKMVKNPEVTVRMRGVMEKCTFCIQRIESAKIAQKVKAGASADVVVPTDSFTTACAQACPAGAIVFGNIADPTSRVAKLKTQERDYTVLEFLLTKPRLTYLAKVRNQNSAMPDYEKFPLTVQDHESRMGHDEPAHEGKRPEHAEEKGAAL